MLFADSARLPSGQPAVKPAAASAPSDPVRSRGSIMTAVRALFYSPRHGAWTVLAVEFL